MAWVNIPDTATDPDAPLTSSLAKAWTGNFKGMADGDPGAPRVQGEAVQLVFVPDSNGVVVGLEGVRRILAIGSFQTTAQSVGGDITLTPSRVSFDTSTDGGQTWSSGGSTIVGSINGTGQLTISGTWSRVYSIGSNVNAVRFTNTNSSTSMIIAVDSFP